MSTRIRVSARKAVGSAIVLSLSTASCDVAQDAMAPEIPPTQAVSADFARLGQARVTLCHRSGDEHGYIAITVAEPAVAAHLRHGDALVGDPVPGQPEMAFDADCQAVQSRRVTTATGSWNGTSFRFSGLLTIPSTGPVDATATVVGADPTWPLRLVLLGYNPQAPTPPGTCGTQWLPMPLPPGPAMSPPTITAHWDAVPPGTYCLNVTSSIPVPPFPPPYSWTVTITHP